MSSPELGALLTSRDSGIARSSSAWSTIIAGAVRERVAAAVAFQVRDDDAIPENVRRELSHELYNTGASNLVLYHELGRVLRAAPSTPVVLKGAALASTVYDDISLRPMSDLDLLIPKDEVESWADTLVSLGYQPDAPEMANGLASVVHYQLAFRGGSGGDVVIELHWNLVGGDADWRAPDVAWFWERTERWPGVTEPFCPPARQLDPLANVLYLSAHALLQHGGARTRLVWLYDIHRLIETSGSVMPWPDVVTKSRELRWDAAVAEALHRCRALFATPVPHDVIDELRSGAAPETTSLVNVKSAPELSRAEHVWRELACLDTHGRLKLALAILFPAPSYMKWRYPRARAAWPLTYPYRWSIVLREAVGHWVRVLTSALSFVCL